MKKNYPKIHVKPLQTLNSQSNPEQKTTASKITILHLKILLQGHSNKNSMAPAIKYICWPMEQNRRPKHNQDQT